MSSTTVSTLFDCWNPLSNHPAKRKLRQYPRRFGVKMVSILHDLLEDKYGAPSLPQDRPDLASIVTSMEYADLWEDAKMVEVIQYVRGGTGLCIPSGLRGLLPTGL